MTKDDKIAYSNMGCGSLITAAGVLVLWLLFGCTADMPHREPPRPDTEAVLDDLAMPPGSPQDARGDQESIDTSGVEIVAPVRPDTTYGPIVLILPRDLIATTIEEGLTEYCHTWHLRCALYHYEDSVSVTGLEQVTIKERP